MRNLIVMILLCASSWVVAGEYVVSHNGLDDNPGTRDKPFLTLNRASMQAKAGDTVIIRGGVYRETLMPRHSGTEALPLVFTAAEGERVVITGLDPVSGWEPYRGKILQAEIPCALEQGFNQVFLDGRMMPQARSPNETNTDLHNPTLMAMQASEAQILSEGVREPDGFWKGGYVVGGFAERWTFQCARIKDSKAGILTLEAKSSPWFKGEGQGYLSGVLGALDAPGEWHIADGRIYFWPPDTTDLASVRVEFKRRTMCVDFNGQSHVTVRGVDMMAGSVRLAADYCALEDCRVSYPSHFTFFPWSGYASDGGVAEGHNGVLVRGSHNTIRGCTIKFSAGSGVVLQGASNLVTRCEISDIDYSGTYACPISLGRAPGQVAGHNRICFNSIHRTGRDCIQLYGASTDDIRYNNIYDSGLICKDLGMIYVYGRDGKGTRIAYNWVHDNRGKNTNPGIYLDNFCRDFVVDHNVIWNCEAGVRVNGPAQGHKIYNNTLFQCHDIGTHTYNVWPPPDDMKTLWSTNVYQYEKANNLFLDKDPDKQLVDAAKFEFWPRPGSMAIDSGELRPGFTDGFLGKAPDLGAYESGGARWSTGVNGQEPAIAAGTVGKGGDEFRAPGIADQ